MASLRDFYSVKVAAQEIGLEEMALYQRIHRKTVKVERIGNAVLVPKSEVERLKQELGQC